MNTRPIRLLVFSLVLAIAGSICVGGITGCSTPPTERVVAVQSLKTVGLTAKAAMDASTTLLKQGSITVEQWQKVATAYDARFQPAYNAAVVAVQADLKNLASPDLIALAAELTNLVASYSK